MRSGARSGVRGSGPTASTASAADREPETRRRGSSRAIRCHSSRRTASAGPDTVAAGAAPESGRRRRGGATVRPPPGRGPATPGAGRSGRAGPGGGRNMVTTSSTPSSASSGSRRPAAPCDAAASCACRTVSCAWRRNQKAANRGRGPKVQQGVAGSVARSVSVSADAPARNQSTSAARSLGASTVRLVGRPFDDGGPRPAVDPAEVVGEVGQRPAGTAGNGRIEVAGLQPAGDVGTARSRWAR